MYRNRLYCYIILLDVSLILFKMSSALIAVYNYTTKFVLVSMCTYVKQNV